MSEEACYAAGDVQCHVEQVSKPFRFSKYVNKLDEDER